MYLVFVNNALQQKSDGVLEPFNELVDQFNPKRDTAGDGAPLGAQLRLWLSALSHVVSRLDRSHSTLVQAIVNMPWPTLDSITVKSYTVFIGMLLSARPEYLTLVLGKIAHGFTHQSGLQALDRGAAESSASPLTRRVIYERLHYLLRHLLSLIPTLSSTLQPLLAHNFPHKRQTQAAQTTYIRNLLRVSSYCPELSDKIMAIIIDRAIQIDVEIQVELDELEEEGVVDEDVFELDPFDSEVGEEAVESDSDDSDDDDVGNLSDLSSDAGDMDDLPEALEIPMNATHIQDMVKKLDSILKLLFDHFHELYSLDGPSSTDISREPLPSLPNTPDISEMPPSSPLLPDSLDGLSLPPPIRNSPIILADKKALLRMHFHTLLSIFDRTIIRTFKSRYTQFLIFWHASLDTELTDLFQGLLVSKALLEPELPSVTRAAAASYVGSLVSRARFVDSAGARTAVTVLCEFLRAHLDAIDTLARAPGGGDAVSTTGGAQHTVFYAVSQAVFLIFCFRWREFMEDGDANGEEDGLFGSHGPSRPARKWMAALDVVQRVVTSSLNPLKVCAPPVVGQFARVAHTVGFVYCYSIIESNRRSEYAQTSSPHNGASTAKPAGADTPQLQLQPTQLVVTGVASELNSFFPFDPYRLPRSSVYIDSVYREWADVAIDEDDSDDDEEDGDEDSDEGAEGSARGRLAAGASAFLPVPVAAGAGAAADGEDDTGGLGESLNAMSISPVRPR
ncbi:hypothetical protein HGRIS_010243 [Hohenbuehelia grisea]